MTPAVLAASVALAAVLLAGSAAGQAPRPTVESTEQMMNPAVSSGRWYGDDVYFGLHYDLHAGAKDTDLGVHATPEELVPSLMLMRPDWVQTDCKGHPGMTSWFSKTPEATVSPGVVKDALAGWRAATKQMGVPLHCHYSGIWDEAAGKKHPDWQRVDSKGEFVAGKMCVRGPYVDKLMIPQMFELIDRYEIDGFWIDGDIWAAGPCWCDRCKAEFTKRTGIAEPPADETDANWPLWMGFTLDSYNEYAAKYTDAVHAHKRSVLVCSNWMQTLCNPGPPVVDTDWLSGDTPFAHGFDRLRCETRFLSTRGKPWDLMMWNFYRSDNSADSATAWVARPVEMNMQEAAVTCALGGNVEVYEHPPVRDGRLVGWRMKRMGELGAFVRARKELCQHTETIPQVAVLISEAHIRRTLKNDIFFSNDVDPARAAVYALLDDQYGVDLLDEWALTPRLAQFPLVVAGEQDHMSDAMVVALKRYVEGGGRLIVTGAAAYERFGGEFLGVKSVGLESKKKYAIPGGDGAVIVDSETWRLVESSDAKLVAPLYKTSLLEEGPLSYAAATVNLVGKGRVAYIPCDFFRFYSKEKATLLRIFLADVVGALGPDITIRVRAPRVIDVVLRQKGNLKLVHLINRSTGEPTEWNRAAIEGILPAGPVTVTAQLAQPPKRVYLAFEGETLEWRHDKGVLTVTVPRVGIHSAVVIEQ